MDADLSRHGWPARATATATVEAVWLCTEARDSLG
jgi:hypothetical protein